MPIEPKKIASYLYRLVWIQASKCEGRKHTPIGALDDGLAMGINDFECRDAHDELVASYTLR